MANAPAPTPNRTPPNPNRYNHTPDELDYHTALGLGDPYFENDALRDAADNIRSRYRTTVPDPTDPTNRAKDKKVEGISEEDAKTRAEYEIGTILAPFDAPDGRGNALNNILEAAQLRATYDPHQRGRRKVANLQEADAQQPGSWRLFEYAHDRVKDLQPWSPDQFDAHFIKGMNWAALATKVKYYEQDPNVNDLEKAEWRKKTVKDNEDFYEPGQFLPAKQQAIAALRQDLTNKLNNAASRADRTHYQDRLATLDDYEAIHAQSHPPREDRDASNRYMQTVDQVHRQFGGVDLNQLYQNDPVLYQELRDNAGLLNRQIKQDQSYAVFEDEVKKKMREQLEAKESPRALELLEKHVTHLEHDLAKRYMYQERRGWNGENDDVDRDAYDKAVQDCLLMKARIEGRKAFNDKSKFKVDKQLKHDLLEKEKSRTTHTAHEVQKGWRQGLLNYMTHRHIEGDKRGKRVKGSVRSAIFKPLHAAGKLTVMGGLMVATGPLTAVPIAAGLAGFHAYTWATARSRRMRARDAEGGLVGSQVIHDAVETAKSNNGTRRDMIIAAQEKMAEVAAANTKRERRLRIKRNVGAVATAVTGGVFFPAYAYLSASPYRAVRKKTKGGHGGGH